MYLKSLSMKGFKSFPDRVGLQFGPGVSVVVGPNGSGKSNVTDAVLWVMGEQSPLAVRGQSMQDVIFGGGAGVKARGAAEVEIVLDNADGAVALPLAEISIMRRLDRTGEGEYRLNGARCRLVDVLETLSDTGLGKESHSVISQGRVDAIVTSKPRDRRLLIEEAAGLGKHRKRRRRALMKLERTQENLDRALDIEREARTRLRPLKRQAEAAELHARLERQVLEVRFELSCEALRSADAERGSAEEAVAQARAEREGIESELEVLIERRVAAEQALAARVETRETLARRVYEARSGAERLALRRDQVARACTDLERRIASTTEELAALAPAGEEREPAEEQSASEDDDRIATLEGLLAGLEEERERWEAQERAGLDHEREQAEAALERQRLAVDGARAARERADAHCEQERAGLRAAEQAVEAARRDAASVGAELAAVNQFLRAHTSTPLAGGLADPGPRKLSEVLQVWPGYELALAAALGGRLDAALAEDLASAQEVLDRAGPDGAIALLAGPGSGGQGAPAVGVGADVPPIPGAERLAELLSGPTPVWELASRLLGDAWVVERLEDLPEDFAGIAVTRAGRVWFAGANELRQLGEGGSERVLAQRNERERLIGASELAVGAEEAARASCEHARAALLEADSARELADGALREGERELAQASEELRRASWLLERRRSAPEEGPLALRRAELVGELQAERRQAERVERERARRRARVAALRAGEASARALLPLARGLLEAIASAAEAVGEQGAQLAGQLAQDRAAGEAMGGELRECAALEAGLQAGLRAAGEAVTAAEVSAQRLRDQVAEADSELRSLAGRLGFEELPQPGAIEALAAERAEQLNARLARLERSREQLGPVNPLAREEYADALAHLEELEGQRGDLERALRELRTLIRDTDRQIEEVFQETFAAAARNFSELVEDLFPGGSGRLRLVEERLAQRAVLGGQAAPGAASAALEPGSGDARAADGEDAEGEEEGPTEEREGVEIEITPAGKSTRRLSLLSGGEKSMTALAFLFAVFLARPCPFYILDEVEAALDDANLSRFLALLRRYAERAQFIVITHQQRTMEAADWLYGVSMGADGVSKVLSRRLAGTEESAPSAEAA